MAKVLVVDDAVDTVQMLIHMLRNQGYEVLSAYSGHEPRPNTGRWFTPLTAPNHDILAR